MNFTISNEAAIWYKEEFNLQNGDSLRFFVRYGGCGTVQKGFSLGVVKEVPVDVGTMTTKNGITFFIEEKDLWYFDGKDLSIELDPQLKEPSFHIF